MNDIIYKIQILERFINKEYITIGTFERTGKAEWWWVCFDASKQKDAYIPFHQGCAISRKDCIHYIRKEYRRQKK